MKKAIFTLSIAALFAACNSTPKPEELTTSTTTTLAPDVSASDTAGASEFQQWKDQQNAAPQQNVAQNPEPAEPAVSAPIHRSTKAPAARIIYRDRPASTPRIARAPVERTYGTPANPTRDAVSRNDAGTSAGNGVDESTAGAGQSTGVGVGTGVSTGPLETPPVVEAPKKKGWSKTAKGAVLGAGSGAVLGAILSKNKGTGAVIGGIIGAAGGYALGKKADKKDAQYQY